MGSWEIINGPLSPSNFQKKSIHRDYKWILYIHIYKIYHISEIIPIHEKYLVISDMQKPDERLVCMCHIYFLLNFGKRLKPLDVSCECNAYQILKSEQNAIEKCPTRTGGASAIPKSHLKLLNNENCEVQEPSEILGQLLCKRSFLGNEPKDICFGEGEQKLIKLWDIYQPVPYTMLLYIMFCVYINITLSKSNYIETN